MRRVVLCSLLIAWLLPGHALAVEPDEVLPDRALEDRARSLSAELRCLVCQNQSIDDSAAPLARDLRILVRERLQAGESDAAIKRYLADRYGDFVLLKPPFKAETMLLWLTPPCLLLLGAAGLWMRRRPASKTMVAPLTAEERARIAALTDEPV